MWFDRFVKSVESEIKVGEKAIPKEKSIKNNMMEMIELTEKRGGRRRQAATHLRPESSTLDQLKRHDKLKSLHSRVFTERPNDQVNFKFDLHAT